MVSKEAKKHNILFVDSSLKVYGGQRSMLSLIKGVNRNIFRCFLACPQGSEVLKKTPSWLRTLQLKSSSISTEGRKNMLINLAQAFVDIRRLIRFILLERIDIIHCQTYQATLIALLPAKLAHRSLIWHDRHPTPHGFLDKILLRTVTKIVFISKAVAKQRFERSGVNPNKYSAKSAIIYNGIEEEKFGEVQILQKWRQKFGISSQDKTIGLVGRISEEKGQIYFIRAVKKVIERIPNTKFLIVGDCFRPEDKKYQSKLKREIKKLNIQKKVIFTGYIDQVLGLMSDFDVLVVPSLNEPFGRVVVEGMGLSIPVIGTWAGGIPEIIEDGKSGILVSPEDSQELAQSILDLLKNKEERERIARQGQQRFLEKFTMKRTLQEVEKLYSKVLKDEN